jgi:MYXO-CTERM domain-containing protein
MRNVLSMALAATVVSAGPALAVPFTYTFASEPYAAAEPAYQGLSITGSITVDMPVIPGTAIGPSDVSDWLFSDGVVEYAPDPSSGAGPLFNLTLPTNSRGEIIAEDVSGDIVGIVGTIPATEVFTLAFGVPSMIGPGGPVIQVIGSGFLAETPAMGSWEGPEPPLGTEVVPLPAPLALLAGGLLALFGLRRRRAAI